MEYEQDINKDDILLVEEYLAHLETMGRKESSVSVFRFALYSFLKKGYNIESLTDYVSFLEEHTVKKRSYYYYDIIKGFISYIFRNDRKKKNKILKVLSMFGRRVKDPRPRNSILSESDILYIISKLKKTKHQLIAFIQKETGVRASDVIRTKTKDIKFGMYKGSDGKVYRIIDISFTKKGDKVSIIPIFNPELINRLKIYLQNVPEDEEFAFCDTTLVHPKNRHSETAIIKRNYYVYWQDLRQACESINMRAVDFSTHDFRRNFAHKMWVDVLKKKDIIALQKALDHAHIDTTTRYLRQSGLETRDLFRYSWEISKGN